MINRVVTVSRGEDAIVGIGQNAGEGGLTGSPWPVEHLGLEPGELVLQVGEGLGQGLDDAGVDVTDHALIGSSQILGT